MSSVRIWTDTEELIIDTEDVGELESAMRFKAENIRAKADPELFAAVADGLSRMWNVSANAIEQTVKVGHWYQHKMVDGTPMERCDACGGMAQLAYDYCPWCGALMYVRRG